MVSNNADPNEVHLRVSLSGAVARQVQEIRNFKSSVGARCWNEADRARVGACGTLLENNANPHETNDVISQGLFGSVPMRVREIHNSNSGVGVRCWVSMSGLVWECERLRVGGRGNLVGNTANPNQVHRRIASVSASTRDSHLKVSGWGSVLTSGLGV